jgi:hypothetical protein
MRLDNGHVSGLAHQKPRSAEKSRYQAELAGARLFRWIVQSFVHELGGRHGTIE